MFFYEIIQDLRYERGDTMIKLWDTHMHTSFSGDSQTPPEEQIKAALAKGLSGLCFTDHIDLDFPAIPEDPTLTPTSFQFDPEEYFRTLKPLAEKYREKIQVLIGVELGVQPQIAEENSALARAHDFDFIIGSVHLVDHCDPYFDTYWTLFDSAKAAVLHYFESTLENIQLFRDFDALGHLDYVVRYVKDPAFTYQWEDFSDVLEAILRFLIQHDKALELNTGALRRGMKHPNPTEGILKFYRSLGGELLTIGADAHFPEHVALAFDRVPGILRECGFDGFHVYKKRKPEFFRLP